MLAAAVVALFLAVDSERRSLEAVAVPARAVRNRVAVTSRRATSGRVRSLARSALRSSEAPRPASSSRQFSRRHWQIAPIEA